MDKTQIQSIFSKHWKKGWGSVSVSDLLVLQELIKQRRPKSLIELGMASGISAAILAQIMEENGGEVLHTVDYDNTFFGDRRKENGFLIDVIAPECSVQITKHPFTTSLDVGEKISGTFDFGFIDANHRHPWPTIDTICLYPLMNKGGILVYDDYALFRHQLPPLGIGTKYLYDQIPDQFVEKHDAVCDVGWLKGELDEVVTFDTSLDQKSAERAFIDALHLPWTDHTFVKSDKHIRKLQGVAAKHYSKKFASELDAIVEKNTHHQNRQQAARFFQRVKRKLNL